jgi:hypothetical protein
MNPLNIDDMKAAWTATDERLDRVVWSHRELLRETKLDRARSELGRLIWVPILELISGLALSGIVAPMIATETELRFLLPAVAVLAAAIFMVIAAINKLHLVTSIDISEPVAQMQRKLAKYGTLRSWTNQWLLCAAPLLWVPGVIVFARGAWGFDIYRGPGTQWLIVNAIFGLAVLTAGVVVAYRYRNVAAGSPFLRRLSDDMTGRSLEKAKKLLGEVTEFENK